MQFDLSFQIYFYYLLLLNMHVSYYKFSNQADVEYRDVKVTS